MSYVTPVPLAEKAAGLAIERLLPDVLASRGGRKGMLDFCAAWRRLAVSKLLLRGTPDDFLGDLYKSGRAWLWYLEHTPSPDDVTSQTLPYLDALASNDLDGARGIALRSQKTHQADDEYEEDFLYMRFLMNLLARPDDAPLPLLARYEKLLEGNEDFRFDACRALLAGDGEALDAALDALMMEKKSRAERLLAKDALDPDEASTTERVSIEGLALVRLATLRGVKVRQIHPLIPPVARRVDRARHPAPLAWQHPESYRQLA
ncbi:Imm49 family immunity protein [Archangium lansingense]|uniref:Imm49 family immunity protein n=1 Tax=Archangium lansingense TaxID=2995310 RepID=A0ABT4AB87_9BACT|nr:Imm49 family immunity protein [Archangium lansinium]MCY1078905.1 Imm49 family immunity protein [Archangium lansinium]